jgi:hypothetical protein
MPLDENKILRASLGRFIRRENPDGYSLKQIRLMTLRALLATALNIERNKARRTAGDVTL